MKTPLVRAFRSLRKRLFHGPEFTALLRRCGIVPHQYWILVDLFETLGKRQEVARMGSDAYTMRTFTIIWFFLSGGIGIVMAAFGANAGVYLLTFLALTAFQLSMLLIPEIAEGLVNPVEGLILAHQPVNGATWLAAKLTHLFRIVGYVVAGVNAVPALVPLLGPSGEGFRTFVYPMMHLLAALVTGLVFGFLCCSLFGWLVRIIPVRRLKAAAAMTQAMPMFFWMGFQVLNPLRREILRWVESIKVPEAWLSIGDAVPGGIPAVLGAAGVAIATAAISFGLRALSTDHLIRVSSLMHSGSTTHRRARSRWKAGRLMARFSGGQAGRAGFEYLSCMMIRDWQFRKNLAPVAPVPIIGFIALLIAGREDTPFATDFAFIHFLPHLIGLFVFFTCLFLAYGNDYKAVSSLAVIPDSSFRLMARGIHAGLWFRLVVVPNAFCLIVLTWSWGVGDALWFIAYGTSVASFYLAVGVRLIDGIPFGKPTPPDRNVVAPGLMLMFLIVVGVAIGIQYLVFRSVVAVAAVTIIVGVAAYLLTRATLADFESRIRQSLNPGAARQFLAFVRQKTS